MYHNRTQCEEQERTLAVAQSSRIADGELSPDEQARAATCTTTLEEVQAALSQAGGKPLSEIIIEQLWPKG